MQFTRRITQNISLVRDAMDQAGFTLEELIEKDLRSVLEAKETKFFPWRKTVTQRKGRKSIDEHVQVIDVRHVDALGIHLGAPDTFWLRGDHAPKQIEIDPDVSKPITVINIRASPAITTRDGGDLYLRLARGLRDSAFTRHEQRIRLIESGRGVG